LKPAQGRLTKTGQILETGLEKVPTVGKVATVGKFTKTKKTITTSIQHNISQTNIHLKALSFLYKVICESIITYQIIS